MATSWWVTSCYCGKFPSFETPLLGTSHALSSFPPTTMSRSVRLARSFELCAGDDYCGLQYHFGTLHRPESQFCGMELTLSWEDVFDGYVYVYFCHHPAPQQDPSAVPSSPTVVRTVHDRTVLDCVRFPEVSNPLLCFLSCTDTSAGRRLYEQVS